MLADTTLWADGESILPALAEEDRAPAERALEVYAAAPKGSSPERVSALVGAAALAFPMQRLSEREADARLELYQRQLADIDADILAAAFSEAINVGRFFPTIAEIREHASRQPAPPRVVYAWRLRQLLNAAPPPAPGDLVDPSAVSELLGTLGNADGMPPAPVPETSEPTIDDYLALGLTEEDARAAMAERAAILSRPRPGTTEERKAA